MKIHLLPWNLSICQPGSREIPDLDIFFLCQTDEEISLVCRTEHVPEKTLSREDGWKAFRVDGPLDFSLIGILSNISTVLANAGIGIFVVSTYNTDYILTKSDQFDDAVTALLRAGYRFLKKDEKAQKGIR